MRAQVAIHKFQTPLDRKASLLPLAALALLLALSLDLSGAKSFAEHLGRQIMGGEPAETTSRRGVQPMLNVGVYGNRAPFGLPWSRKSTGGSSLCIVSGTAVVGDG